MVWRHGKKNLVVTEILLIEDNEGDIELTRFAFDEAQVDGTLHVARDGVEGLAFLKRISPFENAPLIDLILLDLNLPKKDGFEVLKEVKADPNLVRIPVIVMSTSGEAQDVADCYELRANSYISKPVTLAEFLEIVRNISGYWLGAVRLSKPGP